MPKDRTYDLSIEDRISNLISSIQNWAISHDIWDEKDSTFWSYIDYFNDEPPEQPCILVVTCDGELGSFLSYEAYEDLQYEFNQLLDNQGVYQDLESHRVACFWLHDDDPHIEALQDFFEWQWICKLIEPEFSELYVEIFDWFSKKPDDFLKLSSRSFEVVIDGILKNNGYRTKLGTGQADGGVDIRLYSNEVIGEAITLVQAKRYATNRPIGLEAVQALSAAVEDERANRGLFVTTSRYLPGVEKFAQRQNKKLTLATSEQLAEWSQYAKNSIIRDKSKLVSHSHVTEMLLSNHNTHSLEGRIFTARAGATMILNSFVIVLRETKTAVLLMSLPQKDISNTDSQEGYEVPIKDISVLNNLCADTVFRAQKMNDNGIITLWGRGKLYSEWDEKPQYFSYID